MSGEIKFRVHCAATGRVLAYESFNTRLNCGYYWVDATLPEDERTCKTLDYFKHPEPLGSVKRVRFTGLRDANGVDIYEGDIVKHKHADINRGIIMFNTDNFAGLPAFHVCSKDGESVGYYYGVAADDSYIVIGNIYEHPHLLDGSK